MAVEISISYTGALRCSVEHCPSGSQIATDAPLDNGGKGAAFSPTDLTAAALLSCVVTVMALKAGREGIDFPGARGRVRKEMVADPMRRIAKLAVDIDMHSSIAPEHRAKLEEYARTCPVALSLDPRVEQPMVFHYVL